MENQFTLKVRLAAPPEIIYTAWLDGKKHGEMTGSAATGWPEVGSYFTAWDGYISGNNLELVPFNKILQSWRTTDFKEEEVASLLEIRIEAWGDGSELTLIHTGIPEGETDYKQGWIDFYFEPMKKYFSGE